MFIFLIVLVAIIVIALVLSGKKDITVGELLKETEENGSVSRFYENKVMEVDGKRYDFKDPETLKLYKYSKEDIDELFNNMVKEKDGLPIDNSTFSINNTSETFDKWAKKLQFAQNEYKNKNFAKSFYHYLENVYLGLSGYESSTDSISSLNVDLPPDQVMYLHKMKVYYNKDMIVRCIKENPVKFHYFPRNVFENLVNKILNDENLNIDNVYELYKDELNHPSSVGAVKDEFLSDEVEHFVFDK